jgi:hypothetical protein
MPIDPRDMNIDESVLDLRTMRKKSGLGESYLRKEIRAGRLKTAMLGKKRVARAADFAAWLDSKLVNGPAESVDRLTAGARSTA